MINEMHFKSYGIKGGKGLIKRLQEERPRMLGMLEEEDHLRNVRGRYLTEEISKGQVETDKKKQMEETGWGGRRGIEGKENTSCMSLRPRLSSAKWDVRLETRSVKPEND